MPSDAEQPQHWFSKTPTAVATPHPLSYETQARFLALDQGSKVQAEYVWIGGHNELRCKTKVFTPRTVVVGALARSFLDSECTPRPAQTLNAAPNSVDDLVSSARPTHCLPRARARCVPTRTA